MVIIRRFSDKLQALFFVEDKAPVEHGLRAVGWWNPRAPFFLKLLSYPGAGKRRVQSRHSQNLGYAEIGIL